MPLKLSGNQRAFFFFASTVMVVGYLCFLTFLNRPRDLDVVLITIDALRADHLGCYGYKRNTSPNIDALAREGTLFTQAIAQSSHTPASIGIITSSTYPPITRLLGWGDTLNPALPTLPEILKARGYRTVFVGGNRNFRRGLHGFARGFDEFYEKWAPASGLTQEALELVGKKNPTPFFLWIHYMDVHQYSPSPEIESLFINDKFYNGLNKLPIVENAPGLYGHKGIPRFQSEKREGRDNPDYYIALYDGAIRYVDEQVGLLLKGLSRADKKRGLLVILTADHGEMLGEHGYYFHHGLFLYEPLLRIPLIFRCAGVVPVKRIGLQVSAGLDIFPTLLAILRINKPKTIQGADLLSLFSRGASSYVLSDDGYARTSVRTDAWKLVRSSGRKRLPETYELFNLTSDPGEMVNLASVTKHEFVALRKKLDEYRRKFPAAKTPPPALSKEARKGLRSLGYLQ